MPWRSSSWLSWQKPNPKQKHRLNPNSSIIAATLPTEILLLIFAELPREIMYDNWPRWPLVYKEARSIPLVCSTWRGPATAMLFEAVHLRTVLQTRTLHDTLCNHPHLMPLVKTVFLPLHVSRPTPRIVIEHIEALIHLLPSLDEISYQMSPTVSSLPRIGVDKTKIGNPDVRYLGLSGCLRDKHALPPISTAFRNLRCLNLLGFAITERIDPSVVPPLLRLEEFSVHSDNCYAFLDDWLCCCPRLHTICAVAFSCQPTPPRKLLATGRIKVLELVSCRSTESYAGTWINDSDKLRILSITPDVLHHTSPNLPMELHELRVWEEGIMPLKLDEVIHYLDSGPKIVNLVVSFVKHSPADEEAKGRLHDVCNRHRIALTIQFTNCGCDRCDPEENSTPVVETEVEASSRWRRTLAVTRSLVKRKRTAHVPTPEEQEVATWEGGDRKSVV